MYDKKKALTPNEISKRLCTAVDIYIDTMMIISLIYLAHLTEPGSFHQRCHARSVSRVGICSERQQ